MLWILAFLTLILDVDDFTSRNRISVTILLCFTTLIGTIKIQDDYPKNGEFKYIGVWFVWYLTSIFLINCHHILLYMILRASNHRILNPIPLIGVNDRKQFFKRIKILMTSPNIVNKFAIYYFLSTTIVFNTIYYLVAT